MDRSHVAIIIPALNEEASVGRVCSAVAVHGSPIVVDDGSSDRTAQVSQAAGAVVVTHLRPQGYDAALDSGFRRARELGFSYAVTFDADGQHDASSVPDVLRLLDAGHDCVVGVRPKPARLAERLFALYTRRAFGIKDPLCGLKGYRLSAYVELGHFDSYKSVGTELMLYCLKAGHRVAQLPIGAAPRQGIPRVGGSIRANWRIARSLCGALIRSRHQVGTR